MDKLEALKKAKQEANKAYFFSPNAPTAWFSHIAQVGHQGSFHQAAKHKEPAEQTGWIAWLSKP